MQAPTPTRSHPAARGGADTRLPWWAVALPVVAFVALLLLILDPADAQAAAADPSLTHVLERARELIQR